MQTVVFSEIENKKVYETAVAFSKLPDYAVYVLRKSGEREVQDAEIRFIEVEERRQDALDAAMNQIASEQGSIDLLVLSAGRHCAQDGKITDGHDYEDLLKVLDENVNGAVQVVEAALPLMRAGKGKRIALLTEKESSINLNQDTGDYGYHMSLATLNMMMKLLFNKLRPEGFTFRCYAFGEGKGMSAKDYLLLNMCYDKDDSYIHSEENRIVMRDEMLCEIPW